MTKTTPPGHGSSLWRIASTDPVLTTFGRHEQGTTLLVTGPFRDQDIGVKCYHAQTGAVELLLNHYQDAAGAYVVVDMTAGADAFASGLFTRFDLTFVVVEPTLQSVGVYRQYQTYAHDYDVQLAVVGNQIESAEDLTFLQQQTDGALLTWFRRSPFIRAQEKGSVLPLEELEGEHHHALGTLREAVDTCTFDWDRFYAQAVAFHRQNAVSWMNTALGIDVTDQIDPDFQPTQAYSSAIIPL